MNDPGLVLHATQALAAKLGGFSAGSSPTSADDAYPLDRWYANIIRRRKPRVIAINPATLYVVVLPLAPASTLAARLSDALATSLRERSVPEGFIGHVVERLSAGTRVVRTQDRSVVGVMTERARYMGYFAAESDAEWRSLAERCNDMPLMQGERGEYAADRMFALVGDWEDLSALERLR